MLKIKQFDYKEDYDLVYNFLLNNYSFNRENGSEASWFNYSLCVMDKELYNKNTLFYLNEKLVCYLGIESKLGEAYFFFRNNELSNQDIKEIIEYGVNNLSYNNHIIFKVYSKQTQLKEVLKENGYTITGAWKFYNYDYDDTFNYELPNGFSYIKDIDIHKLKKCLWEGFDNVGANDDVTSLLNIRNSKYYPNIDVCVVNSNDDYVGFGGVWIEKKNNLCYLEPLCVISKYRHLGIGKAIISEIKKRSLEFNCLKMTGGISDFYKSIGFNSYFRLEMYEK